MFRIRKINAFIMSLVICSSVFVPTAMVAYANETSVSENTTEAVSDVEAENDNLKTSGDYTYYITELDTVCIESYKGTDTELVIPETIDGIKVTNINKNAFKDTKGIVSITFPATITYISGENPFIHCSELKEIIISEGNENYISENGVLYSKDKKEILCYPQAKEGTSFTVPDSIEEIGVAAIYKTSLSEIKLPSGVHTIKRHGICYNSNVTSIDLSNTIIDYIGDMAFTQNENMSEITFADTLTDIGIAAFVGCKALKEITFPESLVNIGQNAFAATGLREVRIPESVLEIGYCAFGYDEELKPLDNFVIVGKTGSAAQAYATDSDEEYDYINEFTFKTFEQEETEESFEDLKSVAYGDFEYAEVDGEAYITACYSINVTVEVPEEINGLPVTCIYAGAFFKNGMKNVILPKTIKTVKSLAFYLCTNLESITLADGIVTIENNAFDACESLEIVDIGGTCETIGQEVFHGCTSLEAVHISGETSGNYVSVDGVLYNKEKTILIEYPAARNVKKFKAPDSLREIQLSAFKDAVYLEKADISTVTKIGGYAFEGCTALKELKLAPKITTIEAGAFYDCTSLKSVRINEAKEIGVCAFGFYYDDEESEEKPVEGFKIYADEGSDGHRYSLIYDFECISGTLDIFGFNVEKGFVYAIIGIISALLLGIIGIITGKTIKRKKEKKSADELKNQIEKALENHSENKAEEGTVTTSEESEGEEKENEVE